MPEAAKTSQRASTLISLRRRIVFALALAIIVFALAAYYIGCWYIQRTFAAAEEEEVRCYLMRYRSAIAERLREIRRQIAQPAEQRRIRETLAVSPEEFRRSQDRVALAAPHQRWFALVAADGEIIAGHGYDAETGALLPVPDELGWHFASSSPLAQRQSAGTVDGILLLADDPPLLVAAARVKDSNGAEVTLVSAQALYLREISRLCQLGYLAVGLRRCDAAEPAPLRGLAEQAGSGEIITAAGEDETVAFCLLRDIYGRPALWLEMRLPRLVYAQARVGIEYTIIAFLITGVVFGFLFILFFDLSVLRRLSRTQAAVTAIKDGRLDPRFFVLDGKDELTRLVEAVTDMARRLQEYQAGLRQARDILEEKVRQRALELSATHARLQREMEERLRLAEAIRRAEKIREMAAVAASISQAVAEPLASMDRNLKEIEELMPTAQPLAAAAILPRLQALAAHSGRLTAVLDVVRCLIRGREEHTPWRTDLVSCLDEALAAFAASWPSAPRPCVQWEETLPLLAVPAVPLQHMLVYLLEMLASAGGAAAATISVKQENGKAVIALAQPQARLAPKTPSPWRLVLVQALAFSWEAQCRIEENEAGTIISLALPLYDQ